MDRKNEQNKEFWTFEHVIWTNTKVFERFENLFIQIEKHPKVKMPYLCTVKLRRLLMRKIMPYSFVLKTP